MDLQRLVSELSSFPAILAVVAATLIFAIAYRFSSGGGWRSGSRLPLPPGPRPWPIIGNYRFQKGPDRPRHQLLTDLAKKYGPVFMLHLGPLPVVIVTSSRYAEEILKTHDLVFASRRPSVFGSILGYDFQSVGQAPYGPYWRNMRKTMTMGLLTPKRLQGFQELRKTETLRTVQAILDESKGGKVAGHPRQHLRDLTRNNITQMMISKSYFGPNSGASTLKGSDEYIEAMEQVGKMLNITVPEDAFPILRFFYLYGARRKMTEARKAVDEVFDKIIQEHRQKLKMSREGSGAGADQDQLDIIGAMLTETVGGADEPLSDDQIKGMLLSIFIGGTETSAATVEWSLLELLKNPVILKKAQDEINSLVGHDRLVEESDIPRLEYLQAIVKETFRLHPVAPLLIPHYSMEACEVGEFYIPKHSTILIVGAAVSKDPAAWDSPLEFHPERFLGKDHDKDLHGHHYDFLPFGAGRRVCPGKSLGLLLVQYALAVLIQSIDWKLPEGMKPENVDLTELPGPLSLNSTPLEAVATARLPLAVINQNAF